MVEVKRFLSVFLALTGLMLVAITIIVIKIQLNIEVNPILTTFCVISWILFIFTAVQALNIETEEKYE